MEIAFIISIEKINEKWEKDLLYNKYNNIKNSELNIFEKRISAIKIDKTTENINFNKIQNITKIQSLNYSNIFNSFSLNHSFYNSNWNNSYQNYSDTNSTFCNTKSLINDQNLNSNSIIEQMKERKFNSLRTNFYIKNNLYDITLYQVYNDFYMPTKYIINSKIYAFLYPNEIATYIIIISGFLKTEKIKVTPNIPEIKQSKFKHNLGLFFCEKKIEIKKENENKKEIKICSPNHFMCKECQQINKQLYNIKSKYLINIYGRVSKLNKGSFHCFGHFLVGNQIEDCINKFCCKGCEMINLYYKYFNSKK